ncbi:MAG: transcriptional repressor [Actinomycetota bacterium]|nr:transcriptional repressor [Actinomycetota bacterium]MDQ2958167.1 transcriptional repressor [Actinomycetota bacterium]
MPDSVARPTGRLRNTRQAAAVEEVLRDADGFRTAQQLFDEVRQRGHQIGLTTVYRHLNLLAETGSADIVHAADGETQFRLCGTATEPNAADHHHHHLICRVCGRSVEVSGPEVEEWAERVALAAGYTEVTHTLEVFGLCPEHSKRPKGRRGPAKTGR